jgi:predicted TIM-barrel fold metal-dependent hydrolase
MSTTAAARAAAGGPIGDLSTLPLLDHHCHGVVGRELDRAGFEALLTEGTSAGPRGGTLVDSYAGFALRRWCAPVLDLPPHADVDAYLDRRADLGAAEVNGRFLRAAGLAGLCVDTGFAPEPLLSPGELGRLAGAPAYDVVRLESVAEEVAAQAPPAGQFADAVRARLAGRGAGAVAAKSIAAYRVGLALDGRRPTDREVAAAARRWLAATRASPSDSGSPAGSSRSLRLADEVLHRFLVWSAVDLGLPVQFHTGYGDRDLDLHRCDPLLLAGLLRAVEPTGVPVLLLHNYPYHRQAGYLAQVFTNVFVDVGLATHNVGRRATTLLAEALELAPLGKVLFSSDAYGLAELYYLAAVLFRRALAGVLGDGLTTGDWTAADAARIARMIAEGNARRVYDLRPEETTYRLVGV